jgi:hypothetical protein
VRREVSTGVGDGVERRSTGGVECERTSAKAKSALQRSRRQTAVISVERVTAWNTSGSSILGSHRFEHQFLDRVSDDRLRDGRGGIGGKQQLAQDDASAIRIEFALVKVCSFDSSDDGETRRDVDRLRQLLVKVTHVAFWKFDEAATLGENSIWLGHPTSERIFQRQGPSAIGDRF